VILVEFVVGVVGAVLLAVLLAMLRDDAGPLGWVLVAWLLGIAANYLPLALYAFVLIRPGALEAELDGVDVLTELRHYTVVQLWVFVPLVLAVLAVRRTGAFSRPARR